MIHSDIISFTILLSSFFIAFMGLLFLNIRHGNRNANKWLGIFFSGVAGITLKGYLAYSGQYVHFPLLVALSDNLSFFMFPALYFYIQSLVGGRLFSLRKWNILHLTPLIFDAALKLPFYLSDSAIQREQIVEWMAFLNGNQQTPHVSQWFQGHLPLFSLRSCVTYLFFSVYACVFMVICNRYYFKFKKQIERIPNIGRIHSLWALLCITMVNLAMILWIAFITLHMLGHAYISLFYTVYFLSGVMICIATFILFLYPEILYHAKPLNSNQKYFSSHLSDEEADRHFERLIELMEKEEEYLNPDLNLQDLADKLSIARTYLSQIINKKTKKTFSDFVNGYRIERVKLLLQDPTRAGETVLDLAFEAGFNSKTPFNNAFKKLVGESPIVYRKKYLGSPIESSAQTNLRNRHAERLADAAL